MKYKFKEKLCNSPKEKNTTFYLKTCQTFKYNDSIVAVYFDK
jgi:hypothetical protein